MKTLLRHIFTTVFALAILTVAANRPENSEMVPRNIPQPEIVMLHGVPVPMSDSVIKEIKTSREGPVTNPFVANTTEYGQLEALVGEEKKVWMDSLVVNGPIDEVDMTFIKDCCHMGCLRFVNLANAKIKNNIIPTRQFVMQSRYNWLTEIILPEGLTEIDTCAFLLAQEMKYIDIPTTVRKLGPSAFMSCLRLTDVSIPEGITDIPQECFSFTSLTNVKLPESVKTIGKMAFRASHLQSINIPDGLEFIGHRAFMQASLFDLYIPKSLNCFDPGSELSTEKYNYLFYDNPVLRSISFQEGTIEIPARVAFNTFRLEKATIPSSVRRIGHHAFALTESLEKVDFPAGLQYIDENAFQNSGLKIINLPSSVLRLGQYSFAGLKKLEAIYCHAEFPPEAQDPLTESTETAFGSETVQGTPHNVTVYVPKGSLERYKKSKGWSWFDNIVETQDLPVGIDDIESDSDSAGTIVYASQGMLVIEHSGLTPADYTVFSLDGRIVASGVAEGMVNITLPRGIYIVRTGTTASKVCL